MSTEITPVKTRKRFHILTLIFISVVINYMDRTNISVASTMLEQEFSLSSTQLGLIFSAWAWTYTALQIPGGIFVDVVKPRLLYAVLLTTWSLATVVQGFANGFMSLIGCRMTVGAFEAPAYPTNNKIVTSWFPESERATAIAIYTSGQFLGLALLMPILTLIQEYVGWRGLFITTGLIGLIWAVIWYVFYRDPLDHPTVSQQELEHIQSNKKHETSSEQAKFKWKDLGEAFSHKKLWGIYIGQFCLGGIFIFFLTWFPSYLVKYRGFDFIKSGFLASIPFIAAFFGVLLSGFLSDYLTRKGIRPEISRKAPIIIGMLLCTSIVGANYVESEFWIIACLSVAFFGNGLCSIAWVFVSLLAPLKRIGLIGGVFNFVGGLSAVIVPIVIGMLAEGGDFRPALFFIAGLAVVGMLSYIVLVGKVERIEEA